MMGELWAIKNLGNDPEVLAKLLTILVRCLILELNPIQHVDSHPD